MRDHDLMLIAAGATVYLAIAVVPLLLVAVRLSAAVAGRARIRDLGAEVAHLLPSTLGADRLLSDLVEAGSGLGWKAALLSLLPASLYGEGLRRAFLRFSPRRDGAVSAAWSGRLLSLLLMALSPLLTIAVLVASTWIAHAVGTGIGATLLGGYLAFLTAWVLVSLTLVVLYRAIAPDRPALRPLLLGAFGTGSFVAGFLVGFAIFLQLPIQVGGAYGGFWAAGAAAVAGGWLLMLHIIVLIGHTVTLSLDRAGTERRHGSEVASPVSLGPHRRPEAHAR